MARRESRVRTAVSAIQTIELLLAASLFAATIAPTAFGYQTHCVMSGSMEPAFPVGSLVYTDTRAKISDVHTGDPIAFAAGESTVIHRVTEIHRQEEAFVTKGDANTLPDPSPVPFNQVIGITRASVPGLGTVLINLDDHKTIVIVIAVLANGALCTLSWLASRKPKSIGEKKGYPA